MRSIEDERVSTLTTVKVGEHFARVKAAMTRFGTREASRVFNIDEAGISFQTTLNRSLRKGVGRAGRKYFQQEARREAAWIT